ncbi:glucose 1-dehydrogenase [Nocardia sp. NPDC019395]|uniref:SDR family NAD(P)-dependent oxidoreductase n=1 Tax=Nocardia sp. NPDC019395 TaxID=3154686 RepID=UPI0033F597C6
MTAELCGKVAIVTGGADGLGAATVRRFVRAGARVVVADIERERGEALVRELGADTLFVPTDVANSADIAGVAAAALAKFGALDIMVNNAGVSGRLFEHFLDDDLADFDRVLRVNLLGVMAGTQRAARHMADAGGGSIINIASIGGILAGHRVMTYRASKAAVIHFTSCAAIDLGGYGVRVNCIAPGNIPTSLLSGALADSAEARERVVQVRRMMAANRPLDQEGTAHDVAEAALYLGSDSARYVTGVTLRVDGGTAAGHNDPLAVRATTAAAHQKESEG